MVTLEEMREELRKKFEELKSQMCECDELVATYADARAYMWSSNTLCSVMKILESSSPSLMFPCETGELTSESFCEGAEAAAENCKLIENKLMEKCLKRKPREIIEELVIPEYVKHLEKQYKEMREEKRTEVKEATKEAFKVTEIPREYLEAVGRVWKKYETEKWK